MLKQKFQTKLKFPNTVPYRESFAPVTAQVCWNPVSQVGRPTPSASTQNNFSSNCPIFCSSHFLSTQSFHVRVVLSWALMLFHLNKVVCSKSPSGDFFLAGLTLIWTYSASCLLFTYNASDMQEALKHSRLEQLGTLLYIEITSWPWACLGPCPFFQCRWVLKQSWTVFRIT